MNKQNMVNRIRLELQMAHDGAQNLRSAVAGALDENDFTEDEEEALDTLTQAEVDTYLEQVYAIFQTPTANPLDWSKVDPDTYPMLIQYANFICSATFSIIYEEKDPQTTMSKALTLLQQVAFFNFTASVNRENMIGAMQECYQNAQDWNQVMTIALAFCGDPTKSIAGWEAYGTATLFFFEDLLKAHLDI